MARDLTFEERVAAQEAIERVYYSHQIGTTKPFEEAVPPTLLENKVRQYLKQSVALAQLWHIPITAEMLAREMERMATKSNMPDRLREIYAALGNDAFLIQECVARPVLAERLLRNFFSTDSRIHALTRAEAEDLRRGILNGEQGTASGSATLTTLELRKQGTTESVTKAIRDDATDSEASSPGRLSVDPQDFDRWKARLPSDGSVVGPVLEEQDAFTVAVRLSEDPGSLRLALYRVPKISRDTWWRATAASFNELEADAVASTAMSLPSIGSASGASENQGWFPGSTEREIVAPTCLADSWLNGSLDDLPDPRAGHTAVWTGNLMVGWGGYGPSMNTGARYDPTTDTWSSTSGVGAPQSRYGHTAIWTGSRMVVWGGNDGSAALNTGGLYDPLTDTWAATSTTNAPLGRFDHTAVWTGQRLLVWGGSGVTGAVGTGGLYDPSTDTWTPISTQHAPSPRYLHSAVWTGEEMIIWGGYAPFTTNTGGRYDPSKDTWVTTSTLNAPTFRGGHTAIWTGSKMVIWGGENRIPFRSGGSYDPATDAWLPTSLDGAPEARSQHTAIWTGSLMLVWGGESFGIPVGTGGRYDPNSDTWIPTAMSNAPTPRYGHTAIWTGSLMVTWGGSGNGLQNTGGRYDPTTDSWTPTSLGEAPSGRYSHSAVWTGSLMVIWGGVGLFSSSALNTGGRYDPMLDAWSTVSQSVPRPPALSMRQSGVEIE